VRKAGAGRPPKPARQVFEAVMYVLHTGCQWKALPKERFGSARAIHKRFLEWEKAGVFEVPWKVRLAEYDQMEGIAWRWQSIDGAMFKAPIAQETSEPTRPIGKKKRSKRHLLVDGRGVPLPFIVTAGNVKDISMLGAVRDAIVVKRPQPPIRRNKHLCADVEYRSRAGAETIKAHGYIPMSLTESRRRSASGGIQQEGPTLGR
jgi:putative transposase